MMCNPKLVCVSAILLGACLAGVPGARAQNDAQPSVAEAARKAREQKNAAAKPSVVITDDTPKPAAPTAPAAPDQAAQTANSSATANAATSAAPAAAPPKMSAAAEAEMKEALEALKRQIREKQNEVSLQQRALALANDDYYSKPDFSKDVTGKAKLDAMQSDLSQRQSELTELKSKLPAGTSLEPEKPATPPQP